MRSILKTLAPSYNNDDFLDGSSREGGAVEATLAKAYQFTAAAVPSTACQALLNVLRHWTNDKDALARLAAALLLEQGWVDAAMMSNINVTSGSEEDLSVALWCSCSDAM